jgi:hypothetical protein
VSLSPAGVARCSPRRTRVLALPFVALALVSVACSSPGGPTRGSVEFEAHRPTHVRALGALDRTGAPEAAAIVDECVEELLEERGYRDGERTRTATLHVEIEHWGWFDGEPHVRIGGRLVDDLTGRTIWSAAAEERADVDYDEDDTGWLEGVLSNVFDAVVGTLFGSLERTGESVTEAMLRTLPKAKLR